MNLKDLRTKHQLSQNELSEKTGIDTSTISKLENGLIQMSGDTAFRLWKWVEPNKTDIENIRQIFIESRK